MSAPKTPGPQGPPDRTAPMVHPATGSEASVALEKVLAEIEHELGNFFHKLYYWSEYLKERPARKTADSTAAQMLESTIKNLEGFLKVSLEYLHPTELSCARMRVDDLIEGLLHKVRERLNGTPVSLADREGWRDDELLVDTARLTVAFEVAAVHLTKLVSTESAIRVVIARSQRQSCFGVEVHFAVERPNEASPLFRTATAGVEWAVAQKIVALHGGELSEINQGSEGKRVVIFLPLCPP